MEKDTEKRISFLFEYGTFMTGTTGSVAKTRSSQRDANFLPSDESKIAALFVVLLLNYLNVVFKMAIYRDIWSYKIWLYLDLKKKKLSLSRRISQTKF
jgi:hypothetical protein